MLPYAATAAEAAPSFAPQWVVPVPLRGDAFDDGPEAEDVTAIWAAPKAVPAAPKAVPAAPRVVENMPPYIAANGAMPEFHWAQTALTPDDVPFGGLDPADVSKLIELGELRTDLPEEKEHLLTAGTPAWLLPAVVLFCVLATLFASFAGDAVAIARLAVDMGLAALPF